MADTILEIKGLQKLYPGVIALNNVNLAFARGEIHALCGENGAGKSTLIKAISGAIEPTAGEIIIDGKSFGKLTPAISRENGIAVVYQEFTLVPVLTVAENIFMGDFPKAGNIIDKKEMFAKAAEILREMKVDLDPRELVKNLTTGYQQMVEIAKALNRNARIMIMDEPSAPLTSREVKSMFDVVRTLKQRGVTIIYISHRMEEIFEIADRVSVLRDGQYVGTMDICNATKDSLIKMMVGRTLSQTFPAHHFGRDEIVLEAKNLSGNGVKDISFQLHKGEILGFGGLVGAGRTELCEMIFGRYPITGGELRLHGKAIRPRSPSHAASMGIALVPEDRKRYGIIAPMTVKDNLTIANLHRLTSSGVINRRRQQEYASNQVDALEIKTPGLWQLVKNLSGGNQQKVVLGKWLGADPDILIFDEPTRGIDVGAKAEIYKLMADLAERGKSIIMVSSDMEELLGMSDRLLILYRGRFSVTLEAQDFSQESVLRYSAGGE